MENEARDFEQCVARQGGVFAVSQAYEAGFSRAQIARRVATGRWCRLGAGVYGIVGAPPGWRRDLSAALLGAPEDAVVSHLTAAAMLGIAAAPPTRPHLIVPYERSSKSPLAVVHRARLHPIDQRNTLGIRTTSGARTLVDCAATLTAPELKRLVDAAMHADPRLRASDVDLAWDRSQRRPGRHGLRPLRAALEDWRPAIRPGSPPELRLIRLVQQWGYPEPERQIKIMDRTGVLVGRIDAGWRNRKVGLEYDSDRWHGPSRWARDEPRHARLEQLGWRIIHVDKVDLRAGERSLHAALAAAWSQAVAA